jgi:hypothetical protein
MVSTNPYVRGLGLLMASVKPQLAGISILILLWYEQDRLRTLLIPALVFAATTIVWGVDWPIRWLLSDPTPGLHAWRLAHLYPFGLLAFGSVLLVKDKRQKVMTSLYASALGVPWFGVYSYTVFLAFFAPVWATVLSYAWLVAYPVYGNQAMRFAWVLPLSLLIAVLWSHIDAMRKGRKPDQAATLSGEVINRPVDDPPAI